MEEFINDNQYLSDDQLNNFNEELINQIKSDLSSKLKPAFDIDIKSLIDRYIQSISIEYHNYVKIIGNNRELKFNSIKQNCRQFIDEYEREIQTYITDVKSSTELQDKHQSILNSILDQLRKTVPKYDNNLISLQQNYIEQELSNKFISFAKQFDKKLNQIEENYKKYLELSENFYSEVLFKFNIQ